jgi:cell division inhibitor SulA
MENFYWNQRLFAEENTMPKYVIERDMPGSGDLTNEELQGASQVSVEVLQNMGPQIQWVHSYVTGDKIYCIYIAPDEAAVREHAQRSGFPANQISVISAIIDPGTAESKLAILA